MQENVVPVVVSTRVIPASRESLECFSVSDLRSYARDLGVDRGRSKADTIDNLIESGKATLCASLGT